MPPTVFALTAKLYVGVKVSPLTVTVAGNPYSDRSPHIYDKRHHTYNTVPFKQCLKNFICFLVFPIPLPVVGKRPIRLGLWIRLPLS